MSWQVPFSSLISLLSFSKRLCDLYRSVHTAFMTFRWGLIWMRLSRGLGGWHTCMPVGCHTGCLGWVHYYMYLICISLCYMDWVMLNVCWPSVNGRVNVNETFMLSKAGVPALLLWMQCLLWPKCVGVHGPSGQVSRSSTRKAMCIIGVMGPVFAGRHSDLFL